MDVTRQRIVVGIDGSAGARQALAWALAEAARRGADAEVVSAFPVDFSWTDPTLLDDRRIDRIRADTEQRARALVDQVRHAPDLVTLPGAADLRVDVLVCAGPPAAHLVHRSEGAALLVVGSRGRGAVRSAVAGSVALHCAAHARCPVVVVHPMQAPATEPPRVVAGLDDSAEGRAALAAAAALAGRLDARVDAVVAYEAPNYWSDLYAVLAPPPGETRTHASARGAALVREVLGPDAEERGAVRVVAVEGHPGQVLVREAEGALLLAVGSRSSHQLQGLALGSVALHCVVHAPGPVLVAHPHRAARTDAPPSAAVAAARGAG